jgi:hypothetical protein
MILVSLLLSGMSLNSISLEKYTWHDSKCLLMHISNSISPIFLIKSNAAVHITPSELPSR